MSVQNNLPRGIRNNNPGNIRQAPTKWRGKIAPGGESAFEVFDTPVNGLRALMVTLMTYRAKFGLEDVLGIINRWAPPNENATDAYQASVAKHLGVTRTTRLNLFDRRVLIGLTEAIVLHENGKPPRGAAPYWYSSSDYNAAADLAYRIYEGKRP